MLIFKFDMYITLKDPFILFWERKEGLETDKIFEICLYILFHVKQRLQ